MKDLKQNPETLKKINVPTNDLSLDFCKQKHVKCLELPRKEAQTEISYTLDRNK